MSDLDYIVNDVETAVKNVHDLVQLDKVKVEYLGKNGKFAAEMRKLASLSEDEKREFGRKVNEIKQHVLKLIEDKHTTINDKLLSERLLSEKLDMTVPARPRVKGSVHPLTQVLDEAITIFSSLGFTIKEGPSIEDEWYNFTALNFDDNHSARDMHDTFYMPEKDGKKYVLRTHTSPIQTRTMLTEKPPYKIVAPGRTYRCDSDMTHTPMFHQIEALVIDKNIHIGHMKSVITDFINLFFEKDNIPVRFRPSYFPFTEPSAEVDIGCSRQKGELNIGAGADWLEILGCGMVHPNVLKFAGVDPEEYQGFAFGMGLERIAMLKYGIADLRDFFEGDKRWLDHYSFSGFDIASIAGGLTK